MHFAMLVTSVMVVLDYGTFIYWELNKWNLAKTIRCTYTDTDSAQCTAQQASTQEVIHVLHIWFVVGCWSQTENPGTNCLGNPLIHLPPYNMNELYPALSLVVASIAHLEVEKTYLPKSL